MRKGASQSGSVPDEYSVNLLSTVNTASENNSQIKRNTRSMLDKVESARRHLQSHQKQCHNEESSSGESAENRSPHHHQRRSRSSPRHSNALNMVTGTVVKSRSSDRKAPSVLYPAELQHVRRKTAPSKEIAPVRCSIKPISPSRKFDTSINDELLLSEMRTSPQRRNTYLVSGKRDSGFLLGGDATFTVPARDSSSGVADDENIIAPGLLDEPFRPSTVSSKVSTSAFHGRCAPADGHHSLEVSNSQNWEVEFLPGSMMNARMNEQNRRSADLVAADAEMLRYQVERTRREEEQLKRLAMEQLHGQTTKEIFDLWVPLEEQKRKNVHKEKEKEEKVPSKKPRRSWDAEVIEDKEANAKVLNREPQPEKRVVRVVEEDEAGYAMPLPRERLEERAAMRTPSPMDDSEEFFTPATTLPRPSRIAEDGRTVDKGQGSVDGPRENGRRQSLKAREVTGRINWGDADRSMGSSFYPSPDRRERSMRETATPEGRGVARYRDHAMEVLNSSLHDRSRDILNESMNAFERSINSSLDQLSSLAAHLTSQLEASKANLSAIATAGSPKPAATAAARTEKGRGWIESTPILTGISPMEDKKLEEEGDDAQGMSKMMRDQQLPMVPPRAAAVAAVNAEAHTAPTVSHELSNLLDANLGVMERTQTYEAEAERLAAVTKKACRAVGGMDAEQKEKETDNGEPHPLTPPQPTPRSYLPPPPRPLPRSRSSSLGEHRAPAAVPALQLAIQTAGGSGELMEMYEARHRNWHRRGDDIAMRSPLSASRSPSPLPAVLRNSAEMRERQSKQGMLDIRAKAVRGTYLHLLQRVYTARYERKYEEKRSYSNDASRLAKFALEQKRLQEQFKCEAAEAKRRAVDPLIKYRDFMQWLKRESERMEDEIQFEVEKMERRRWERKSDSSDHRLREPISHSHSMLDTCRLADAHKLLDERASKAMRVIAEADRVGEKREEVRRMEREARRALALVEIPSSARSSIDDACSILQERRRRYSIGNEPLRVTSGRGMDPSQCEKEAEPSTPLLSGPNNDEAEKEMERRKDVLSEMKEKLEERRRQAQAVTKAMKESEEKLTEKEIISVAARLSAHDEYVKVVETVGRAIGESVQPKSPVGGLPPGVDRLDLSSLEDDGNKVLKEESTCYSVDSLESAAAPVAEAAASTTVFSLAAEKPTTSSSSTCTTLSHPSSKFSEKDSDEHSRSSELSTVDQREVVEEANAVSDDLDKDEYQLYLGAHEGSEQDRSLPSTVVSSGRQEIAADSIMHSSPLPPPHTSVVLSPRFSAQMDTVVTTAIDATFSPLPPVELLKESTREQNTVAIDSPSPPTVPVTQTTSPHKTLFSPLMSSTERSTDSSKNVSFYEERGTVPLTINRSTVEEITGSSSSEEERMRHKAVGKKVICVATEMTNPFDDSESSESSGKKKHEQEEAAAAAAACSTSTASTLSPEKETVLSRTPHAESRANSSEISSWDDAESVLEVGVVSTRSEELDWGTNLANEKAPEVERKGKSKEQKWSAKDVEEREEKCSSGSSGGKLVSFRERLREIYREDEQEEQKMKQTKELMSTSLIGTHRSSTTTTTTTTTTSSSTRTGTSSASSSESGTSSSSTSRTNTSMKGLEEAEEGEEATPRAPSATCSDGGASSASGSIHFDVSATPLLSAAEEVPPSSRTPRLPTVNRFRLSLNDSLSESPRDSFLSRQKSSMVVMNGRVAVGAISPRNASTPTSPHTPRAVSSPGGSSPDGRRSRFTAVMPASPRSARRSTSPRGVVLSREVSLAVDDSSLSDISRLSAIDLPTQAANAAASAMLSSLPPIVPPLSMQPQEDQLDESFYDLNEVQSPGQSALSSVTIGQLLGEDEEEKWKKEGSSSEVASNGSSSSSLFDLLNEMNKKAFIKPRIEKELEKIWSVLMEKGWFSSEDAKEWADEGVEDNEGNEERKTIINERIRHIRGVAAELAASMYARDVRILKDGRFIPRSIIPLRKKREIPSKDKLQKAVENELMRDEEADVREWKDTTAMDLNVASRLHKLRIDIDAVPVEERWLLSELYANEDKLFHSDLERRELVEILLSL